MATGKSNLLPSVHELLQNPKEVFLISAETLIRIADNILKDPNNDKYRRIRVGNAIISEKLLPVSGAIECLFEMGFIEDGEFFTLPKDTTLVTLRIIKDQIQSERQKYLSSSEQPSTSQVKVPAPSVPTAQSHSLNQVPHQNLLILESHFFSKLKNSFDHVLVYEDVNLQAKARECIPIERLQQQTKKKHASFKIGDVDAPDKADLFLLELLAWFKNEFFSWVNALPCELCGGSTQSTGMTEPTPAELQFGASRVEHYYCPVCQAYTRFPRYNSPGKLLETRRGRCGEWANCFTLCCRATGYEARYVLDWTDHVWTEVYSVAQKRWLHCDACENVCDKPLLYEAGWGKRLTYILAFSKDDLQDVTWRYTNKHTEVLTRRQECRESWLVNVICRLRKMRQSSLSEGRKKVLNDRLVVEMVEMLTLKEVAADEELGGRVSGSEAWRRARGELGGPSATSVATSTASDTILTVITPTNSELKTGVIHILYCCATDKYFRPSDNNSEVVGWQQMTSKVINIMRKEESDWKKVYLARTEGSNTASISWKIDVTTSKSVCINHVDVEAKSECFEDGRVSWRLCSEDNCAIIPKGLSGVSTSELAGSQYVELTAELSRGRGECAWQHTQLFRQDMRDTSCPLSIRITLKKR